MRAPLSAIEPARLGVSMRTRGEAASAASRVMIWPGALPAARRLRRGCRRRLRRARRSAAWSGLLRRGAGRLLRALLRLLLLDLLLLLHLRQAEEILPADQHERGQHDGENGVLLVGHLANLAAAAARA